MRTLGTAKCRLSLGIAALAIALCCGAPAPAGASDRQQSLVAPFSPVDARASGSFLMTADVTAAVNVTGEHRGQTLTRHWTVVPDKCIAGVCTVIRIERERDAGNYDNLSLYRVAPGTYAGYGLFYAGLKCGQTVYPHGSQVSYRLTLTVASTVTVDGTAFAQHVTAVYTNTKRTDATPCPLGPSHDAAKYSGTATSPAGAPVASFGYTRNEQTMTSTFGDASQPDIDGTPIVSWAWTFGDPGSGAANTATGQTPVHQFSKPGTYDVILAITDALGRQSATFQQVAIPGPPNAVFGVSAGVAGTYAFTDMSAPGVDGGTITSWHWNFGDPSSGAHDTSTAESPTHKFTGSGTHTVTLTVTDTNGFTATATATQRADGSVTPGSASSSAPSAGSTITTGGGVQA